MFLMRVQGRSPAAAILLIAQLTGSAAIAAEAHTEQASGADAMAAQARELAGREAVYEAIDAYDQALRLDPHREDLRLEYATYLRTWGFWHRGAEQYAALLAQHPDHVDALLGYGELLNSNYQFEAALEQCDRAKKLTTDIHRWELAMLGYGSAQFGLERYRDALATFEELLAKRPSVLPGYSFLAVTKRRLGDLTGAEAAWNALIQQSTVSPRGQARRREIQDLRTNIEKARAQTEATPRDPIVWSRLGDVLRDANDLTGATVAYEAAIQLAPADRGARLRLGVVLRDAGKWGAAMEQFRQASGDPMHGSLAKYNLAYCARRAGDRMAEGRAWEDASTRTPMDLHAYGRFLDVIHDDGRIGVEKARVQEQVRLMRGRNPSPSGLPVDPMPLVRLSMILQREGDMEGGRAAAVEAVGIDVNHVHARRMIRSLFALEDDAADALLRTLDAQAASAAAGESRRLAGALRLALGLFEKAEPDLRAAVAKDDQDAVIRVALGSCLRELGQFGEALEQLKGAAAIRPDYVWALLDIALTQLQSGDPGAAAASARQALTLQPDSAVGYALLGTALRQSGDLRGAASALEKALALDPPGAIAAPRLLLARINGAMGRNDEGRRTLVSDLPMEPDDSYQMVWEFVRDTYHDRTFNGQDWRAWRDRFDGTLETPAKGLGAIALMLSSLDDRNTRMRDVERTIAMFFTPRSHETVFDKSGAAERSSQTVEARRLEDNVGYIAITNLDDPRATSQIKEAVETLSSADGIILDLRGNMGGSDADVAQITGMFVKSDTKTGTIVSPERTKVIMSEAPPGRETPIIAEDKPVVVLVDRNTASSAENLAGSLKQSRRAVVVGEKTFGKAGIQMPLLLPGGSIILVVSAEHADLEGNVYTGVGIEPDVKVENPIRTTGDAAAQTPGGEDRAVSRAREVLKRSKK